VRGTAEAEGFQQMTQRCCVFAENIFEDEFLKFGVVNSNRTSTDFKPIEDEIVMEATNLERISVNELQIFRMRLSERVMCRL
jgi:hypothetical protein